MREMERVAGLDGRFTSVLVSLSWFDMKDSGKRKLCQRGNRWGVGKSVLIWTRTARAIYRSVLIYAATVGFIVDVNRE